MTATPVAALTAADSWFLGYTWSLLQCAPAATANACNRETHLGWRFTSPSGDAFDALIVTYDEQPVVAVGVSAVPVILTDSIRFGRPYSHL